MLTGHTEQDEIDRLSHDHQAVAALYHSCLYALFFHGPIFVIGCYYKKVTVVGKQRLESHNTKNERRCVEYQIAADYDAHGVGGPGFLVQLLGVATVSTCDREMASGASFAHRFQ